MDAVRQSFPASVERWSIFELRATAALAAVTAPSAVAGASGPAAPATGGAPPKGAVVSGAISGRDTEKPGNPFVDVSFSAVFRFGNREAFVEGFCDGEEEAAADWIFRIRFMPDAEGEWSFRTRSNIPTLDGISGAFECTAAEEGNHGPVRVVNTYHFAYEDGTPYEQVGTTCYAWVHQGDELEEKTLDTLRRSPFNKLRMCVFPKDYVFNSNEPTFPVYRASSDGTLDFSRPNPLFFRHLEKRIGELRDLGIEADLILFHPYDRWGYSDMGAERDNRYLRYIVARLAAYRNVWWSFANEYDLMKSKTVSDWDRFFRIVWTSDPSGHLRSIHNCRGFYDHGKPWVSHCSIQSSAIDRTVEWRDLYGKPVIFDECKYEGNIHRSWGNITGGEMVHRFWEAVARGGYAGHGETYVDPDDILWWAKGGALHGSSPKRIAFLKSILEKAPVHGLDPAPLVRDSPSAGRPGQYYLLYLGISQPAYKEISLPHDGRFKIELIDTWEMTIRELPGSWSGEVRIDLPSRQYMALRITRQ